VLGFEQYLDFGPQGRVLQASTIQKGSPLQRVGAFDRCLQDLVFAHQSTVSASRRSLDFARSHVRQSGNPTAVPFCIPFRGKQ
jgi:hypothetical protein